MPWGPKALRNSREEFVLEKIEYFKVNVYKGRSDWTRHYFDSYREAIKFWRELYRSGKKVFNIATWSSNLFGNEVATTADFKIEMEIKHR